MFTSIYENVQTKHPLVHCITNYVTVNDCANILLACGASPIMADDILEVEEITSLCQALVINIGTLNERTIDSMIKAGKRANELGNPVILDPVGAGASTLRTGTALRLLDSIRFSVIRGNISEIKTLYRGTGSTHGVDADAADALNQGNIDGMVALAKDLSLRTGAVIVITGVTDLVADAHHALLLHNGHPMMSKVTGTGCMLSAMLGAFCAANPADPFHAAAAAVSTMGVCGEAAFERLQISGGGTGSFKIYMIDALSQLTSDAIYSKIKMTKPLHPAMRLYAVTDRSWLGCDRLSHHVEQALKGGTTFLQIREKTLSFDDFVEEALRLKELTDSYHVPFVINDNIDVALAVDADGVHIGQSDVSVRQARLKLGQYKIIGVSARSVDEAIQAQEEGADYIGVGAVFPTTTKSDASCVSSETLSDICRAVKIPVVAIGGITSDNAASLKDTGIDGIAVVSALFSKPDIHAATVMMRRTADELVRKRSK